MPKEESHTLTASNAKNLLLDILSLLMALSLYLFYRNMFYLHIIAISLMIFMLIKCYYQGIKNGLIWLSLIVSPMIISLLVTRALTIDRLSEIMLILVPSITVGLLAEKQRRYVGKLKETYVSTLKALAEATDARDTYTQGHSKRVAKYTVLIAKEMLLPESEINYLEQAALLHDIGKIAVPDRILHKRESLQDDEWSTIRKHPEYSQKILSNLSFLSQTLPTILYHHKRFDNQGYPAKEAGIGVPLGARILAVADAFDAMTSDRPYRDRLTPEQALKELEENSGTQFDPGVVKSFKRVYSFITP